MDRKPVFALVDCNNFFASCERVFRPDLKNEPVAVLSNNDGVVVARSNEVKKMGIPMATPVFKVKKLLENQGTHMFSANFVMYGDFSRRVVEVLENETPHIEVYSVDESFLEVGSLLINDYQKWAQKLAQKVERWTGIPVSVGVGPSKTLAKAAAEYAKKHPEQKGGFSVVDEKARTEALKWLPVEDVWGIGRRLAPKLKDRGVRTAYDLTEVSEDWALKTMGILRLKTIKELQGESNIPIEYGGKDVGQKSISSTRTFGKRVRTRHELESAVASFAAKIAQRLRRKDQVASEFVVFLRSGIKAVEQHNPSLNVKLDFATSDTGVLTAAATEAVNKIVKEGHSYKKGGIYAHHLLPAAAAQLPIENTPSELDMTKSDQLMKAMDDINKRWGKGTLITARESSGRTDWKSKREKKSPAYTTLWVEIPSIR